MDGVLRSGATAFEATMTSAGLQTQDAGTPAAQQHRAILDAIPAIAWCKLPDGSNEFVNQRWQDFTGISADEARGQGWQAAVHPEDLPKLITADEPTSRQRLRYLVRSR
jgi:PAS domain-containing protein